MAITVCTEVFPGVAELAQHGADWIAGQINACQSERFAIALSGGSTVRSLYRELALRKVDWSKVHFFWIDERFVPPDHPDSNFRLAQELLISAIGVSEARVHPVPTDGDPANAARAYEATLKVYYGAETLDPNRPLFDLVILSIGVDGHFCSLLPGSAVLNEKTRWVAEVTTGRPEVRITLTYPAVKSSRLTVFFLAGGEKADVIKAVRDGDLSLPAARLKPLGDVVWLLDYAAAAKL